MVEYNKLRSKINEIEQGKGIAKFFSGSIFKSTPWFLTKIEAPEEKTKSVNNEIVDLSKERVPSEDSLSKESVLESLKEKVEEKGEIQSKFGSIIQDDKPKNFSASAFPLTKKRVEVEGYLNSLYSSIDIANFKNIKLLIVGESQTDKIDQENPHWKYEHNPNELLGKMILAMKLEEGDFLRTSLCGENEIEQLDNVLQEVICFRPDVVVTLGAISTNLLYSKREKLSKIHGQSFERTIEIDNEFVPFKFVPVFHPELLEINPSMKRTAWIDLQKIMEMIGKK
jgi:DNA polymerase